MKQEGGHVEITRTAVHMLFQRAGQSKILGLTESEFFDKLNAAQEKQDSFFGLKTWLPYWLARGAQREHSVADPRLSGEENLSATHTYIVNNLYDAWQKTSNEGFGSEKYDETFKSLGRAIHALQDSYSRAHVERDPDRPLDPTAAIVAFNVFDWPHGSVQAKQLKGIPALAQPILGFHYDSPFFEGTHVAEFDAPAISQSETGEAYLDRAADQNAAFATATILDTFLSSIDNTYGEAFSNLDNAVHTFFRGGDEGVKVFRDPYDPEFQKLLKRNFESEVSTNPANLSRPDGTVAYSGPPARQLKPHPGGADLSGVRSRPLASVGTAPESTAFADGGAQGAAAAQATHLDQLRVIDQQRSRSQQQMLQQQRDLLQQQNMRSQQRQLLQQRELLQQQQIREQQRQMLKQEQKRTTQPPTLAPSANPQQMRTLQLERDRVNRQASVGTSLASAGLAAANRRQGTQIPHIEQVGAAAHFSVRANATLGQRSRPGMLPGAMSSNPGNRSRPLGRPNFGNAVPGAPSSTSGPLVTLGPAFNSLRGTMRASVFGTMTIGGQSTNLGGYTGSPFKVGALATAVLARPSTAPGASVSIHPAFSGMAGK